jgi:hypothetical protein
MKRLALFPVLLICAAALVYSLDFGLLLSQEIEAENEHFTYTPAFTPWFSWDGGKNFSVYVSNKFFFEYHKYNDNEAASGWARPPFISELTYSAVNYRINESMSLEAGRIEYADPLEFAATGLFDGARFEMDLPQGTLSAGAFYTGFLYRETALILMTPNDGENYAKQWGMDNLGAYFASRRFLTAVRWDMPLGEVNTFSAEVLLQVDMNGNDQSLHSQYAEVKMALYPLSELGITAGALFEMMEYDGESYGAFGLLAVIKMDVPGPLNDWLSAGFKLTSGRWNDDSRAFTPISCVSQGDVFPGILSGLAYPSTDYSVRLHNTLFAEGSLRYFIRTDSDSNTDDGNFYGGEMWASLAWQPLEDIRLTVGAGVFFPGLGNVFPKDTDPMWKINAVLTLSL